MSERGFNISSRLVYVLCRWSQVLFYVGNVYGLELLRIWLCGVTNVVNVVVWR